MMISRVPCSQVMVHAQVSGTYWHSFSIASQFGGKLSKFCGIYFFRIWKADFALVLPRFPVDANSIEVRGKLQKNGMRQLIIEAEDDDRLDLFVWECLVLPVDRLLLVRKIQN